MSFTPYPFQVADISKLENQKSSLIASEMGAGKTHEAIALDELWNPKGILPTLVIAPINTWDGWLEKYAMQSPQTDVTKIDRKKAVDFPELIRRKQGDVFLMHWEALHKLSPEMRKLSFQVIVADEVHRASGRNTLQTKALKRLKTEYKLGMSGTATGDKPDGLYSVLNWLFPNDREFSSYWRFRAKYCLEEPIFINGEMSKYSKILGPNMVTVKELHEKMEPYYVRHLKKENCCADHPNGIMPWLPDKQYDTMWVDLNPRQRRIYKEMQDEMVAWVGRHDDDAIIAQLPIVQMMRLSQMTLATPEIYEKVVKNKETGEMVMKDFVRLISPSPKIDALKERLSDHPTKQFVVWSSSKATCYLAQKELQDAGISSVVLSGDTPQKDREGMVNRFRQGDTQIFIGVIKAAGEGIDGLQHATDTAFFLDRELESWRNLQAEDRLFRAGQKNATMIIDILARKTIDIRNANRALKKWGDIKQMLGDAQIETRTYSEG